MDEELLIDEESLNNDHKNLEEEIILVGLKNSGHKRTSPQESPRSGEIKNGKNKCSQCLFEFQSKQLLDMFMKTHKERR